MSHAPDDREGLSPPLLTAAQLGELWEDEDDDGNEYEPASEMSEDISGTEDDESEENDYLGIKRAFYTIRNILTVTDAEDGLTSVDIEFSIEGDPDVHEDDEDDEGERTETEEDQRVQGTASWLPQAIYYTQNHSNKARSHPHSD